MQLPLKTFAILAYISKSNRLTCIKCYKPLPKLKEKLHVYTKDNFDKSIYQCFYSQYIIKAYLY